MDLVDLSTQLVRVIDLSGVAANALLASTVARINRFDPVGFLVLGVVSGLGGGMLRDVLLQQGAPVALTDAAYLTTALLTSVLGYLVHASGRWVSRGIKIVDAVALGAWGAVGAQKALNADLSWLAAVLVGTLTAVGGGMIRDVLVGRVPAVFGGTTLYATCAAAAAVTAVILQGVAPGLPGITTLIAAIVGGTLCLLSYRRGWRLPEAPQDPPWVRRRG